MARAKTSPLPTDCGMNFIPDEGVFVIFKGVRIAKRGDPGTPQAGTWIALEPGFSVLDNADRTAVEVTHQGVRIH